MQHKPRRIVVGILDQGRSGVWAGSPQAGRRPALEGVVKEVHLELPAGRIPAQLASEGLPQSRRDLSSEGRIPEPDSRPSEEKILQMQDGAALQVGHHFGPGKVRVGVDGLQIFGRALLDSGQGVGA